MGTGTNFPPPPNRNCSPPPSCSPTGLGNFPRLKAGPLTGSGNPRPVAIPSFEKYNVFALDQWYTFTGVTLFGLIIYNCIIYLFHMAVLFLYTLWFLCIFFLSKANYLIIIFLYTFHMVVLKRWKPVKRWCKLEFTCWVPEKNLCKNSMQWWEIIYTTISLWWHSSHARTKENVLHISKNKTKPSNFLD